MKSDIHPEYNEATITCACGSVVQVKSVRKEMHVNACSTCHPFYTGRSALVDAKGRVEQFRKRYAKK
jgi:large subunit ribosomal protein L31